MAHQNNSNMENGSIDIEIMADGHVDMHILSRAVLGALEYWRVGFEEAVNGSPDEIAVGKAVINCAMQAFSLECALKGVHQALGMTFPKDHDLSRLFTNLPSETRHAIETKWVAWTLMPETSAMTFGEFVDEHKNDFVQWRYLTGARLESAYFALFAATMAANSVTREIRLPRSGRVQTDGATI